MIEFNSKNDYESNNIDFHSGVMMSTTVNPGVYFQDDRCPVCANPVKIYYASSYMPVAYICNRCGYTMPILRDNVGCPERPDTTGETFKFLSTFGSNDKFSGLTRMAIDRSIGGEYLWEL